MCLSPITIPNQSKYVSLKYRDKFLMQVPCGHCADCAKSRSNEWYFRAYSEFNDLSNYDGAYCLFDTLTYSDKFLPHLSDTWSLLSKELDFPCFSYHHIRCFLQLLRQRLIRLGYSKNSFRYFLSSEYGHDNIYLDSKGRRRRGTNRPHYHIIMYVLDSRVRPLALSKLISELWKYGQTDGVPYKPASYVMGKNVLFASSCLEANKLRTCKYVTKYVQKSCEFSEVINDRLNKVMTQLAQFATSESFMTSDEWLNSEVAHRERLKLSRYVSQFHRQSQHFGESALRDIDLNEIFQKGCFFMSDAQKIKIPIPLSTYYKRKLFYEQVQFNGSRYWQLNDLGLEWKKVTERKTYELLKNKYKPYLDILCADVDKVVDYCLNYRGCLKYGSVPSMRLENKIDDIDYISYCSSSDKLQFGCRGLTSDWLGDSQQGYSTNKLRGRIKLSSFIEQHCFFDQSMELILSKVYQLMNNISDEKQSGYELKQRLVNKYKLLDSL